MDVGGPCGGDHLGFGRIRPGIEQVVADRRVEKESVLEDHADLLTERLEREIADVVAIEAHRTQLGISLVLVLLPAPVGPTSAASCPGSILKETSFRAARSLVP